MTAGKEITEIKAAALSQGVSKDIAFQDVHGSAPMIDAESPNEYENLYGYSIDFNDLPQSGVSYSHSYQQAMMSANISETQRSRLAT
jgi:hypothetical protein